MPPVAQATAEINAEPYFRKDGEDVFFEEIYSHRSVKHAPLEGLFCRMLPS